MLEIRGNLWDFHSTGFWICITTNGVINTRGELVMGRGTALEAKRRHPELPKLLGDNVKTFGNEVNVVDRFKIISFPTKYDWRNPSDPDLILKSAMQLQKTVDYLRLKTVVLPRPGTENGGLDWEDVKPIIAYHCDDHVLVISPIGEN